MKPFAAALLLTLGCVSSDPFVDRQVRDCGPGQDLSIQAGLSSLGTRAPESARSGSYQFAVEIANNSHRDLTVESIQVEQVRTEVSPYHFESSGRKVNQVIEAGDDHLFEMPILGRSLGGSVMERTVRPSSEVFLVTVSLSNGEQYRCRFEVPIAP